MSSFEKELPVIFLKPGEVVVTNEPRVISTILGSCVSVTMLHRPSGHSAMCHALLPKCQKHYEGECPCPDLKCFSYVRGSICSMLEYLSQHGVRRRDEIETKLFGGSDVLSIEMRSCSFLSVGQQNINMARQMLESQGLKLISFDVGGPQGRKIFFNTCTGEVLMKRLRKIDTAKLAMEEQKVCEL
jgi:chemotaxis protein CheD